MFKNPYNTLGVNEKASSNEIKAAYRELVKKHHPDTGGDQTTIIELNAAWEILGDADRRHAFDTETKIENSLLKEAQERGMRNAQATDAAHKAQGESTAADNALLKWLKEVYTPIDRLLGQVINPFSSKLQDLAADPYDDELMETFCTYLEQSQKKLEKIEQVYRSMAAPVQAREFSLNLYHCLSQVQDAFHEIERYTMGYVDNYLHDGRQMLREAKKKRALLSKERPRLKVSQ